MSVKANLLIMWGNSLYEHSHLRAAGGADWKPLVEAAAAKFKEAGEWLLACLLACFSVLFLLFPLLRDRE